MTHKRLTRILASLLSSALVLMAFAPGMVGSASAVAPARIRGVVRTSAGTPIKGARVVAFTYGRYPDDPVADAVTAADGSYEITVAPAAAGCELAAGVPDGSSFGSFYGGTSATDAKRISAVAGGLVTGADFSLTRKPRRPLPDLGVAVGRKDATRMLTKDAVRIAGDHAVYEDAHGLLVCDLSSGTPSESVLTTSYGVFDLDSQYAFVDTQRIALASGDVATMPIDGWVEGVSCDDAHVAYTVQLPTGAEQIGFLYALEICRASDRSLVRTILLPEGSHPTLMPGAVSNGRVAITLDGTRVVVYDIGTGHVVRDFEMPDPQTDIVGDGSCVLAGDRLVWTDSARAFAATLTGDPATSTVADASADRLIGGLAAGGDRVSVTGWLVLPGDFEDSYVDAQVKLVDLATKATSAVYSLPATETFTIDGMNDVAAGRVAWLDKFMSSDAGPVGPFGLSTATAAEVWQTTDAGPAQRIDTTRYAENDQMAGQVKAGRVAWLDDIAAPAGSGSFDLLLRDVSGSTVTTVDSGIYPDGGPFSAPMALGDHHILYVKPGSGGSFGSSMELWSYDIGTATRTRIDRNLQVMGFAIDDPWVVYAFAKNGPEALAARNLVTGETRTLATSQDWNLSFTLSHGVVYYQGDDGVSRSYEIATGTTKTVSLPLGSGWGPDALSIDRPHYGGMFSAGAYEQPGWNGDYYPFISWGLGNADTGERFLTDPFSFLLPYGASLSGRWMLAGSEFMDVTSGDYYTMPVAADDVVQGSIDGETAAVTVWDENTQADTVRIVDLSGIASPTRRLGGATRVETGVTLSKEQTSAATVLIATARNFPDALAGVPLAHAVGGPVLLTEPGGLSPAVAAEVQRLGATKAYILGSTAAVSASVESSLAAVGVKDVTRLQGPNRYATAQAIAGELKKVLGHDLATAFIATGGNFPDALSGASVAARMGAPILLTQPAAVPQPTKDALASIGATGAVVLGSEGVVSAAVAKGLGVPVVDRLGGASRYDTCAEVAQYGFEHHLLDAHTFAFAIGNDFPDALGAGALTARLGVPLLLVNKATPATVPTPIADLVTAHKAEVTATPIVVGSEYAVSLQLQERISQTLR